MSKRPSMMQALARDAKAAKASPTKAKPEAPAPAATTTSDEWKTTAMHLRKDQWTLLRSVARKRADDTEGRASVSDIIRDMIEKHRAEL